VRNLKVNLKKLFTTWQGLFSWFIANVITSLPWIIPLIYGFIFKDKNAYIVAGSTWAFLLSPLAPLWIVNVIIAIPINKFLTKLVIKKNKLL
jgi:hypothetical protein